MCFCCYIICFFLSCVLFFFFKQKPAYELRISDWSSDVCSSDLGAMTIAIQVVVGPSDRCHEQSARQRTAAAQPSPFVCARQNRFLRRRYAVPALALRRP